MGSRFSYVDFLCSCMRQEPRMKEKGSLEGEMHVGEREDRGLCVVDEVD